MHFATFPEQNCHQPWFNVQDLSFTRTIWSAISDCLENLIQVQEKKEIKSLENIKRDDLRVNYLEFELQVDRNYFSKCYIMW